MATLHLSLVLASFFLTTSHVVTPNPWEDRSSTFNPFPVPRDPTANQALTNRLTNYNDTVISSKKGDDRIKAMYDQGSFRSFNMEITQDNLAIMNQDPTQQQKVHCRFTTDYNTPRAKTFSSFGVGCGIKGSVGSLRICVDEYHRINGNCRKLSYRVEANAFHVMSNKSSPQDFYGLRSISFGGMPVDWGMMSERTAFKVMGDLGIAASLAVHGKLFLNGKYLGIFSLVEEMDATFTKMHWKKDDNGGRGSLYKELWLNPLHMQALNQPDWHPQKHDGFMREVMNAITACPLTGGAPLALFNKYFDLQSLIDVTAFNTCIGNTDDWRLRHNFFWYVREDKKGTKLVFIPWDYDRLDDTGSSTRALSGKPWWDIEGTTANGVCNMQIMTPSQIAQQMGGSPAMIAYNTDMYNQFPPDLSIPVTCDKITQLMAIALGPMVRQRTLDFSKKITASKIQAYWHTWNAQIASAVTSDPDGPTIAKMLSSQTELLNYFTASTSKAVQQVRDYNLNPTIIPSSDDISGWVFPASSFTPNPLPPPSASSLPPLTRSFAPASTFTSTLPSFSSTTSLSTPSTSFGTGSFGASPVSFSSTASFAPASTTGLFATSGPRR